MQRGAVRPRRWAAWAHALLSRLGRTATDHRPSDLVLVRPVPLVHRLHQQWILACRQVMPRIHLAIQPLLRSTVLRDHARMEYSIIDRSIERHSVLHRHDKFLTNHDRRMLAPVPAPRRIQVPNSDAQEQEPEGKTLGLGRFPDLVGWQSPVQLVYQRLRHADTLRISHRRNSTLYQDVEHQTREIRQRIRRVEQHFVERSSLVFRQQIPQLAVMHANADQTMVYPAPTSVTPAAYGLQAGSWTSGVAPTPPNIEHLADQVMRQLDRRMTAWRERTGRI